MKLDHRIGTLLKLAKVPNELDTIKSNIAITKPSEQEIHCDTCTAVTKYRYEVDIIYNTVKQVCVVCHQGEWIYPPVYTLPDTDLDFIMCKVQQGGHFGYAEVFTSLVGDNIKITRKTGDCYIFSEKCGKCFVF